MTFRKIEYSTKGGWATILCCRYTTYMCIIITDLSEKVNRISEISITIIVDVRYILTNILLEVYNGQGYSI